MPELPEVQTTCDGLIKAGLAGSTILVAEVTWPKTVAPLSAAEFEANVKCRTIQSIERRGKYIQLALDNRTFLLIHLRMTGRLDLLPSVTKRDKHQHVILGLDGRRDLRFHDTRKFGRMLYTNRPERILSSLGPEPLGPALTADIFYNMINRHKRLIKPLLLDQTFIAGLGNIYTDESLWLARLHPRKPSNTLTGREAARLLSAIRRVLKQAIANLGTSLGEGETNFISGFGRGYNRDKLAVFRRTGKPCPRCGTAIHRIIVGQRGTHICTVCQTEPA